MGLPTKMWNKLFCSVILFHTAFFHKTKKKKNEPKKINRREFVRLRKKSALREKKPKNRRNGNTHASPSVLWEENTAQTTKKKMKRRGFLDSASVCVQFHKSLQ